MDKVPRNSRLLQTLMFVTTFIIFPKWSLPCLLQPITSPYRLLKSFTGPYSVCYGPSLVPTLFTTALHLSLSCLLWAFTCPYPIYYWPFACPYPVYYSPSLVPTLFTTALHWSLPCLIKPVIGPYPQLPSPPTSSEQFQFQN